MVLAVDDEPSLLYGHCAQQPFMRATYVTKVGRRSKRAQAFNESIKSNQLYQKKIYDRKKL
ncbi:hypothetical protein CLJ1_2133 [Pseudomonas paraeruginosa]|nr:hypothetical protein CLJ1_2133 [Pseudomonas aeruginosa]